MLNWFPSVRVMFDPEATSTPCEMRTLPSNLDDPACTQRAELLVMVALAPAIGAPVMATVAAAVMVLAPLNAYVGAWNSDSRWEASAPAAQVFVIPVLTFKPIASVLAANVEATGEITTCPLL